MKSQRWIQLNNNTDSKIIVLVILLIHFQIHLISHLNLIPLQKSINHNIEKNLIQLKQFPLQNLFINFHCFFDHLFLKQSIQINTIRNNIPFLHFQKNLSSFLNFPYCHRTLHKRIISNIIWRKLLTGLHPLQQTLSRLEILGFHVAFHQQAVQISTGNHFGNQLFHLIDFVQLD